MDCVGLTRQDEKSLLEGVLGFVVIVKDRTADPQDHGTMALDNFGERAFISSNKPRKQVRIRGAATGVAKESLQSLGVHHSSHI